ncbi:hypothetical protein SP90_12965 [Halodesulfovibrio spirochaetisodalis]|uniref:Uncharacterized protein n=1 Tax=Halodesulfovibrio spirochaetisodalis TaxID=1560234 RepID=A0A1B7XAK0_9BACT|nr:hypothetical protein SP90_12965 [Halodesulfovibrio spirochaetisodalis]
MTYGNTVIVFMCVASMFLPYERMRYWVPLTISLSGVYLLIFCIMINLYTAAIWLVVGGNFFFAMIAFLLFYLGREKK